MKGENPNKPEKGSTITVEPIRDLKDIASIKKLLSDKPRDLLLFTVGINSGLRMGDILKLKVGPVRNLKPGDQLTVKEGKTGKTNVLVINKAIYKALQGYLDQTELVASDYLFQSRKGYNKPLRVPYVNNLVKSWAKAINLPGNYGAHTPRKTFGYIQRTQYGIGFEVLAKRFNHSNPAITMRYLGINDKEVNGILMNEI